MVAVHGSVCPNVYSLSHEPLFTKQYKLVPVQCKLGANQALDVTHWSCVHGIADSTGVWLRATETEISTALWAFVAWEELYFFSFYIPSY